MTDAARLLLCALLTTTRMGGTCDAATQSETRAQHIGTFSQLRETGEHVYGYEFQLWRDDDELVGLWSRAEGQPADFPTVIVKDLKLDESTGSLRFTIPWCGAVQTFNGTLKNNQIVGQMTDVEETTKVKLLREDFEMPPMGTTKWKSHIDRLLTARAPRCP